MKGIHLVIVLFLFSCNKEKQEYAGTLKYFDLRSLVESNVKQLEKSHPKVKKTWMRDTNSEEKIVENIDWVKEMKLFNDADLNKSSYLTSYDSLVQDGITTYFLKEGESTEIKKFSVVENPQEDVQEIHIETASENIFYSTRSTLVLSLFKEKVHYYSIGQNQKLLWFRPDSTFVSGEILD